jgi:hypothetical protein
LTANNAVEKPEVFGSRTELGIEAVRGLKDKRAIVIGGFGDLGGGSEVNFSSVSGFVGQPNFATCNVTKFALCGLTQCWAQDLAPSQQRFRLAYRSSANNSHAVMKTMTDLERFHACMAYQPVDHAPFWAWGGWPETLERWKKEGYDPKRFEPEGRIDQRNVFGHWFFPHPPFEHKVVEEDAQTITYINHEGILMRERKDQPRSSMPQFLKFPVETRAEFRQFWQERMQPDLTKRIGPDWQAQLRRLRAEPKPFIIISDRWGGFFGPIRNLLGVENLCTALHDDPRSSRR